MGPGGANFPRRTGISSPEINGAPGHQPHPGGASGECRATVLIEMADASEDSPSDGGDLEHPLDASERRTGRNDILIEDAVRDIAMPSNEARRFISAGCEQKSCRCLKRLLRKEWKVPTSEHQVVAYWRAGHTAEQVDH